MSSCVPVTSQVVSTSVGQTVATNVLTITGAPQTVATTVSLPTSICVSGSIVNGTAGPDVCEPTVTLLPTQTVIPGTVSLSTQLVTNPVTQLVTSTSVGSTCQAVPSSSSSSSSSVVPPTSSRTSDTTSSTSAAAPTSVASSAPTASAAVLAPSSAQAATPSDSSALDPSAAPGRSTITSFRTVIVTSTGVDGKIATYTSAGTLNSAQSGHGSTNTGAIAGGVVGGVAVLALIAVILWLLRSQGFFKRDDEQFDDDMWSPHHHSPDGPGGAGDDPYGTAAGGALMNEKDAGPMSDGGHGGGTAGGNRASWYGSDGGRSVYPDRMGGSMGPAGGYETAGPAALSRGYSSGHGDRQVSRQHSMRSGSGHSHEGYMPSPYSQTLPPIPSNNYRFSQHGGYVEEPSELPYGAFPAQEQFSRQQSVRRTPSGSREGPLSASDHSDSARTAATTGSSNGLSSRPSHRGHPQAMTSIDNSSMPVSRSRPHLAVLTNESNSGTDSSLSGTSQSSISTTPSSAPPATPADFDGKERLVLDNQFLKAARPVMERNNSSSSFIVPSQFLGARIVNA